VRGLGWEKGIVGWVVSDSGGIQKSLGKGSEPERYKI
jgi:hypothetical protein